MESKLGRREFLVGAAGAAASLLLLPNCGDAGATGGSPDLATIPPPDLLGADLAGADLTPTPSCVETEPNILGPFYRANAPERTALPHPTEQKLVVIRGNVRGNRASCGALDGAVVEIWQADETGAYDNTTPQYLMRGTQRTGADGSYRFETILPGWYLNGAQYRPRHIHFKLTAPGFEELVTQLYFKDDPYLADDPFYHPSLVMPLVDLGDSYDVIFDIVLATA